MVAPKLGGISTNRPRNEILRSFQLLGMTNFQVFRHTLNAEVHQ
jgi:hypothetical protein